MLSDFYQIIVHLNTLADHLRDLLQKEVDFGLTGTWNEIIIDSTVYRHQPIWDILAILEKKKKKKTVAIKLYPIIHDRYTRQIDDVFMIRLEFFQHSLQNSCNRLYLIIR